MKRRVLSIAVPCSLGLLLALGIAGDADTLDPRIEAAVALYREQGAETALPEFQRLAAEFRGGESRRDEAAALHYVGECHWRLGNFDEARAHLDRALVFERDARDRHAEGKTLNVKGLLEWDLGNYPEAQRSFRDANAIAREVGDRRLEGSSLNNLSLVYDELGDYETSLAQYRQVLAIYHDADFPRGIGDTLGNIGGVHLLLGQFRQGLDYYRQALAISERLESKPSMSQDHGNIALCLLGLGEIDEAIRHFDSAIALARAAGMRQDEAYWLGRKANGLIQTGDYARGLELQRAALTTYEEIGAQAELAEALHDMGELHLLLGDPDSADQYFTRALELARRIELSRGITANLLALGDLQLRLKRLDAAATQYEEARTRAVEAGERHVTAQSLLRLAQVHREQRQATRAES
jgi:tetratricopeptide (TPR) repeat protein